MTQWIRPSELLSMVVKGMRNPKMIYQFLRRGWRNSWIVQQFGPLWRRSRIGQQVRLRMNCHDVRFDTRVGEFQVNVPDDSYYARRSPDEFEPQVVEQLSNILNTDDIFYDIGSYFGYYVHIAMLCGIPPNQIHAFECNHFKSSLLKHNCGGYGAKINNAFVGGKSSPDGTTLDTYVGNNEVPDVIKIDVEGAEFEVLKGAEDLLKAHHPTLLIEVHTFKANFTDSEIIDFLRSDGYSLWTTFHHMLRTETEQTINKLSNEDMKPVLDEVNPEEQPYLLIASFEGHN